MSKREQVMIFDDFCFFTSPVGTNLPFFRLPISEVAKRGRHREGVGDSFSAGIFWCRKDI